MDERKLLIADDSELNRAILVSVLEKNFDILEAADGKEAIATRAAHEGNIAAPFSSARRTMSAVPSCPI